jgi:hypothetical protein
VIHVLVTCGNDVIAELMARRSLVMKCNHCLFGITSFHYRYGCPMAHIPYPRIILLSHIFLDASEVSVFEVADNY